jgi:hypothetical protein
MAWLGSALPMPLRTTLLIMGISRSAAAYLQAGRGGLPVLANNGTDDTLYDAEAATQQF